MGKAWLHGRPPTGQRRARKSSADMSLMSTICRKRWQSGRARWAPVQVLAVTLISVVLLLGARELHGRPLEEAKRDWAKDAAGGEQTVVLTVEKDSIPSSPSHGNDEPIEVEAVFIDNAVRSSRIDQPLVRIFPGYMPADVFNEIQEGLLKTTDKKDESLFKANFRYTSGWMVRFNAEGIHKFKSDPRFELVLPFFERVLNDDANAFVMNLLTCYQPFEGSNAIEYHVDNSVGIKNSIASQHTLVAHQVNVLYISIPKGLQGGALEVWPFENQLSELGKAIISPAENLMAEFRGDAFHRVGPMKLDGSEPRVGLVFEQYKVSSEFYPYTIDFCFGDQCAAMQED